MECNSDQHATPHRWPMDMEDGIVADVARSMPTDAESRLDESTLPGLLQDVGEAEQALVFGLLKSASVMCRRVIQLGIEEKLPSYQGAFMTLGGLMRKQDVKDLLGDNFARVERVNNVGNQGAHHKEIVIKQDVESVINDVVHILNGLSPWATS